MNIKTTLKTTVAAAALFAVASPAFAGNVVSGGDNFTVKLSGQFNKAIMFADSGPSSGIAVGDNETSRSRIWITPSGTINEAVSVTGRLEIMTSSNGLAGTGIDSADDEEGGTGQRLTLEETWMSVTHKDLGSIQIGRGSAATDGAGEGVFNPAGSSVDTGDITDGDAIQVYADGVSNESGRSGLTVTTFFDNYGGGDTENVKYTTPTFAGFQLQASTGASSSEVGVYYGGKFGGFAVSADFGYADKSAGGTVDSTTTWALGVKHDSGFSIGGGWGGEEIENATSTTAEGETWYVLAGYEADLTSMGKTGFAVQYIDAQDTGAKGDSGKLWGIGVNQGLASGIAAYAGAQFIEVERTGTKYQDITTFMAGMKVSF